MLLILYSLALRCASFGRAVWGCGVVGVCVHMFLQMSSAYRNGCGGGDDDDSLQTLTLTLTTERGNNNNYYSAPLAKNDRLSNTNDRSKGYRAFLDMLSHRYELPFVFEKPIDELTRDPEYVRRRLEGGACMYYSELLIQRLGFQWINFDLFTWRDTHTCIYIYLCVLV